MDQAFCIQCSRDRRQWCEESPAVRTIKDFITHGFRRKYRTMIRILFNQSWDAIKAVLRDKLIILMPLLEKKPKRGWVVWGLRS